MVFNNFGLAFGLVFKKIHKNKHILLIYEYMFGIMLMDTFEIYQMLSLSIIKLIKERGDIYDKKRNISICYYITSTCYNNIITS